jgi:cyanuric acid amidohydrolase
MSSVMAVKLAEAQIILVGNHWSIGGDFPVGHDMMNDMLDIDGNYPAIAHAGIPLPEQPRSSELRDAVVNWIIDTTKLPAS